MAKKASNPGLAPGKKRVTTVEEVVEDVSPGGELDLETADPGEEGGDDFLSVLSDLAGGAEARCEIRRTSPSEFAGYCCTYALSEMSLDRLQAEWGGGKFSVRVRAANGEFKGSTNIQIAGRAKNRDDAPAVVSQQPQAPAIDIGAIVTAATAGTKAQVDMLQGLVTALINKPAPQVEKGPDVLEVVTALAPILKPDRRDSGGDSADAVKLLMQGIELGKDLAGGGGSGDTFTDLALKGMDMVKTVAAQTPRGPVRQVPRPQRPAAPPARLAAPAPGTVPAQESPAAKAAPVEVVDPEAAPMLKLLGWIKQQTTLLVYQAARGKDPGLYAELFLDNLPDGVTLEMIYERMSGETALADLEELTGNTGVSANREWFEKFREEVLAQLTDDEEGEEAAPPAGEPEAPAGGGES